MEIFDIFGSLPVDLSGDVKRESRCLICASFPVENRAELRTGSGGNLALRLVQIIPALEILCTWGGWQTVGNCSSVSNMGEGRDYRFEWKGVWEDRAAWQFGGWGCEKTVNSEKERKVVNEAFDTNSAGEDMFDKISVAAEKPKIEVAMWTTQTYWPSQQNIF